MPITAGPESKPMPASWKKVVIAGELTVLVAFTAVGVHVVMQPHRPGANPAPLVLPIRNPDLLPPVPILPPLATAPTTGLPRSTPAGLSPDLLSRLDQADRGQLSGQWGVLQALIGAIEQYLQRRVIPAMEHSR